MLILGALWSAIRRTFDFSGRSDRLEHWAFMFATAVIIVAMRISIGLGVEFEGAGLLALVLGGMWLLIAHVSLFVRRLHDNNRTGLYLLIPAAAGSLWLSGWLGSEGYVDFDKRFFLEHGEHIMIAGRMACQMCSMILVWIFLSEGDEDENRFGEPPL